MAGHIDPDVSRESTEHDDARKTKSDPAEDEPAGHIDPDVSRESAEHEPGMANDDSAPEEPAGHIDPDV